MNASVVRMKHGISIRAANCGISADAVTGWRKAISLGFGNDRPPGFHFIPSGLLFLRATRQAGRGFWRTVMLKQKCRLDERSVIRQTANSVRYVAFSRMA